MTRIIDLLHSLTAVIIRYHDAQKVSEKLIIESNPSLLAAYSLRILTDTDKGFKTILNELITQCTKGYLDRKHLLTYLVNEIVFLKTILDNKQSFSSSELEQYKAAMTQMLLNFKQLLLTAKSATCRVKYSQQDLESGQTITLNGLVNDGYFGNTLCLSGDLLAEVLGRLNLSYTSSDEDIRDKADILCTEHQNALLVPELEQHKKDQAKVIEAEQDKVTILNEQIKAVQQRESAITLQLEQALEKIKKLEAPTSGLHKEPSQKSPYRDAGFLKTYKNQLLFWVGNPIQPYKTTSSDKPTASSIKDILNSMKSI